MPGAIWAIVVAGGEGRRFGGAKQFIELAGASVLERSVRTARCIAESIVAVVPQDVVEDRSSQGGADVVVAGGDDRAASVRAGLAAVPRDAAIIIVHDAARPLASPSLFRAVVAAVIAGADGAVPGIALTDTVKRVAGNVVIDTLNREELIAVQTPQAFRGQALRDAHAAGHGATDDAALLERFGAKVVVVPGESRNIKLTEPRDVEVALRYLQELDQGAPK